MSKNYASKVIVVAEAEVGYLEKSASAYKKDPSILDKKTDGAGKDNYTKYGRDMHKIYPSVMDFPAYWCDAFVDWCFYTAYGITTAKSLLGGNFDDYTVASCQMYEKKSALGTTPKKGAQVFFTKNGKSSGCHHTGIVYKVDNTSFYTIEGNTSGASGVVSNGGGVAKKSYKIASYSGKVLFGYPKYDEETSSDSNTSSKSDSKLTVPEPTLRNGSSGEQVKYLQKALNKLVNSGLTVDGDFGNKTEKALKTWQSANSLTSDGVYGPKSQAKMKKLLS
jgi:hypothetical protein